MPWRYQPVYIIENEEKFFAMVEVHFDDDGRVKAWTTDFSGPGGNDQEELQRDIAHLMLAAHSWVPVPLDSIEVGQILQALVSMDDRRALAEFIDGAGSDLYRLSKQTQ